MNLTVLECRGCGAAYWVSIPGVAGGIVGGPCCKGLPVLDIERFPTERAALRAYPAWAAADLAAMLKAKTLAESNHGLRHAA